MTALPGKKKVRFSRAETRAAWLCLLPSVIGLVCITYLPMIASFALSLFSWNGLGEMKYIGLDKSLKDEKRLVFVGADRQIDDELYIYAGCIRKKVEFMGAAGLQMKKMDVMLPDFFDHEIYLMINESGAAGVNGESGSGKKVLISGCSHKGILNIVEWFRPDVLIGGFHFSNLALDDTLKGYAERLNGYDITYYTCHCTGTEQYEFMKKSMSRLNYLSEGMTIEI